MSKNTFFTGQPIFSQLLSLIPSGVIALSVRKHMSDHYYKKFRSYDHLVAMLYASFQKCTSLREVTTGLMACHQKLGHLGLRYIPRRSTLAEANQNRSDAFFSDVYSRIYRYYFKFLPDSRIRGTVENRLFLIDSTTITLFSEVMKGMGIRAVNGRRKGGAKAHMLVKATEDVPRFVLITPAAASDKSIFNKIELPKGAIVVFDKGYNHYGQFELWRKANVTWVTRMVDGANIVLVKKNEVSIEESALGVIADDIVFLGRPSNKKTIRIKVRRVIYHDHESGKEFIFITNGYRFKPSVIAGIYDRRWQIELLFKRLKQNHQLHNFLGESENAIKIQIWCALITDLLLKIVSKRLKKKWSFANISAMVRLHLMNYLNLFRFLNNPDQLCIQYENRQSNSQLILFTKGAIF